MESNPRIFYDLDALTAFLDQARHSDDPQIKDWFECFTFSKESSKQPIKVKSQRKRLTRAIKAKIWAKTNGSCWHCGISLNPFDNLHIDHLKPIAQDGTDDISNLVPSCADCNLSKGSR